MCNKKGFTLVELCVVMALVAIVSTMVMSFIVWTTNQNAKVQNTGNVIADLASFETAVENWLAKYDSTEYTISVDGDNNKITVANGGTEINTLSYNNKLLKDASNNTVCSLESCKDLILEAKKDGNDVDVVLIKCTIYFENDTKNKTNDRQEFYFTVHSNIVRERYVDENRQRKSGQ